MYNEKQKFTRLTLDQSDLHVEWSVPYEDISGEDMMQAIKTIMIGMTFSENTVEKSMADYLQDHCEDFEVFEKKGDEDYIEEEDLKEKPHFYA